MLVASSKLSFRAMQKCIVTNFGGRLSSIDRRGLALFSTQAFNAPLSAIDDIPSSTIKSTIPSATTTPAVNLSIAHDFRKEHQIRIIQDSKQFSKEEEIKYFPITTFSPDAENSVSASLLC